MVALSRLCILSLESTLPAMFEIFQILEKDHLIVRPGTSGTHVPACLPSTASSILVPGHTFAIAYTHECPSNALILSSNSTSVSQLAFSFRGIINNERFNDSCYSK